MCLYVVSGLFRNWGRDPDEAAGAVGGMYVYVYTHERRPNKQYTQKVTHEGPAGGGEERRELSGDCFVLFDVVEWFGG